MDLIFTHKEAAILLWELWNDTALFDFFSLTAQGTGGQMELRVSLKCYKYLHLHFQDV